MNSLQKKIQQHYPSFHEPIHSETISPIPPNVATSLRNEIESSDYADIQPSPATYLQKCNSFTTYQFHSISMHVATCDHTVLPIALIHRVLRRIHCLWKIFGIQKPITYWVIPSDAKKALPHAHEIVKTHHINSGYTYPMKNAIFLLRWEEFPKVALHEAIHHLPMDMGFEHDWNRPALQKLYQELQIDTQGCQRNACSTRLLPSEAVVETWAEIMQLLFLHHEYGFSVASMLQKEQAWALEKARAVIHHQRSYFPKWSEETHAYSYMVLRAGLLHEIERFLKIPIPYDSIKMTNFLLECHNKLKPLLKTPGKGQSFRMTLFGNL